MRAMSSVSEAARQRGLPRLADALASAKLPPPAPADPDLATPIPSDPLDAVQLLPRRGVSPELVRTLLPWFRGRPLEAGLFAWDALCRCFFGAEHGDLLAELRSLTKAVKPLWPAPGVSFPNLRGCPGPQAVASIAQPAERTRSDDELMSDAAYTRSLGALEELRSRHGLEPLTSGTMPETTRGFAAFLDLAHLSTLSAVYLDYLWRGLGLHPAVFDLVEVLCDSGGEAVFPPPEEIVKHRSSAELELVGYMNARRQMMHGQHVALYEELHRNTNEDDYRKHPPEKLVDRARSHIVYAQAAIEAHRTPVPVALIDQIVVRRPTWRHAHRMRVTLALSVHDPAPDVAAQIIQEFVSRYGNDVSMWVLSDRYAREHTAFRATIRQLLSREAIALPHDRSVWTAFARMLGAKEAMAEIDARAAWQCTG
jgi:hypothetical protein